MPSLSDILAATNLKPQSPYAYMQAAGAKDVADGGDGSTPGVHLRWEFYRSLGDNHIPKGNLANSGTFFTENGFSKQDDFVTIFKVPYTTKYPVVVDFENNKDKPDTVIAGSGTRLWRFNKNVEGITGDPVETSIVLIFKDLINYDIIAGSVSAETNPGDFIQQYTGILEVFAVGNQGIKLSFAVTLNMKLADPGGGTPGTTQVETVSVAENDGGLPDGNGGTIDPQLIVTCREEFTDTPDPGTPKPTIPIVSDTAFLQTDNTNEHSLLAENIQHVRLKYVDAFPLQIKLETYEDFVIGAARNTTDMWQDLGDFGLSLTDTTVFDRLDNTNINVNDAWPRFNPPNPPQANAFTVNTSNYEDKWTDTSEGFKLAVENYLTLSKATILESIVTGDPLDTADVDNLKAFDVLEYTPGPGEDFSPDENDAKVLFSYQEMLKLAALDYHVARMLGLGYVDPIAGNQKFIYLMAYETNDVLEVGFGSPDTMHFYMTLPTGKDQERLPHAPTFSALDYGLFTPQVNPLPPLELTRTGGYDKFNDIRYVRLLVDPPTEFNFPEDLPAFFNPTNTFCLEEITDPVFYGVEYKNIADNDYVVPELSNDPTYVDGASVNEVLPIPNDAASGNPLFIHSETEEGVHEYAVYAINWFSRVSPLSAPRVTDATAFLKVNTLLPPSNLSVQLIQKETPLILTSTVEQAMLSEISPEFKIVVTGSTDNDGNYTVASTALNGSATEIEVYEKIKDTTVDGEISYSRAAAIGGVDVGTKKFTILGKNLATEIGNAGEITVLGSTGNDGDYTLVGAVFTGGNTEVEVTTVISNTLADGSITYIKTVSIGTVDDVNRKFTVSSADLTAELGPPGTEILVRATFQWNHTHNIAYTKIENSGAITEADRVELFFREDIASLVRGKIQTTTELAGDKLRVKVQSYTNSEGTLVNPVVPAGDESKFEGSSFSVNGIAYIVESVVNSAGLKFTLFKNSDITLVEDSPNSNIMVSSQVFSGPEVGDLFTVEENIVGINSWPGAKLNKEVTIENFRTPFDDDGTAVSPDILHTEEVQNEDGGITLEHIGGIYEKATIIEFQDVNLANPDPNPPNGITGSITGVFKIVLNTFQLTDHPDDDVDWKGGTVRIRIDGKEQRKVLEVTEINRSGSTLELIVTDPTFEVDEFYMPIFEVATNVGYQPIETGTNILVNFHPGYRVYLQEQSGLLDKAAILPTIGDGTKQTFLTVRAVDELNPNPDCESDLARPEVLRAIEISPPLPPGIPMGALFATRPGFDGKSTYTFDTEVIVTAEREPFSMVFFRASERTLLDVLYAAEGTPGASYTVESILADIAALEDPFIQDPVNNPDFEFLATHWNGLANAIVEKTGADIDRFGNYPPDGTPVPGVFRFPNPNNPDYILPDANPNNTVVFPFLVDGLVKPGSSTPVANSEFIRPRGYTMYEAVQQAINSAFLPLTENPVLYKFIKSGEQTSNKKPAIRDSQGVLLEPSLSTPGYDPSPMCVIPPSAPNPSVRFTDYTLDGASINIYFYYGIEIGKDFIRSGRSPIFGPISLVNSFPAKAVEIKKVTTELADITSGTQTAVVFEVNPYLESERIIRFEIYRALRIEDTLSLRSMTLARTVEIAGVEAGGLKDNFSDVPFPLFGETLFYRIVAIREIENEQHTPSVPVLENIPSFPSVAVKASIVDVLNPIAPEITFNSGALTSIAPRQLPNGVLKWNKATHNGKYFLYKMNNTGDFELLDTIISNDSQVFFSVGSLVKEDDDGNAIFHRYKVTVENSSGLLNTEDNIITI